MLIYKEFKFVFECFKDSKKGIKPLMRGREVVRFGGLKHRGTAPVATQLIPLKPEQLLGAFKPVSYEAGV